MTAAIADCFAQSYSDARGRFLAGCLSAGAELVGSYRNPKDGPSGEALFTDVARLGPADADKVLILESGTHGAEGYAGSGIQTGLLTLPGAPRPPKGVALLLVHALNPWGFAWTRRTNEDNVDLNRSFVDHEAKAYTANPGYEELADAILPKEWTEESIAAAEEIFQAYIAKHGPNSLNNSYKYGQHTHPNGLFFGGVKPTWSAGVVEKIADEHLSRARNLALIDLHTGLGPFGHGDCLAVTGPDTAEGKRSTAWYGKVSYTKDVSAGYSSSDATIIAGYRRAAPNKEWTSIGLEFGTRPPEQMRVNLRAEAWLNAYGSPDHPDYAGIKAALRDSFYPQEPDWADMVMKRGLEVVEGGLRGMAAL